MFSLHIWRQVNFIYFTEDFLPFSLNQILQEIEMLCWVQDTKKKINECSTSTATFLVANISEKVFIDSIFPVKSMQKFF